MDRGSTRAYALLLALTLIVTGSAVAQPQRTAGEHILPPPAGALAIGRVSYHWIDSTRTDALAKDPAAREVMVDVWYPTAVRNQSFSPYLPQFSTLRRVLPDSILAKRFAPAYAAAAARRLYSHAVEGAPAKCPVHGCPLLVFSHGGGVDRSMYTAQYEDFASHGYVIAAIAHTYLTHTVVFPDGRVLRLQDRRSLVAPPVDSSTPYWRRRFAESAAINQFRYAQAAADVRFVLDQIVRYAGDPDLGAPFVGQLDLNRIGAIGHSMGGLAVAVACRNDARIKACLNQDGTNDGLPADRDATGRTLSQPFMFFGRVEPPSAPRSDSVLTRIQMTRQEDDSIRQARPREQESILADVARGAWRLRLRSPRAQHMSFSDELLIEAARDPAAHRHALQVLDVIHRYSRAFFDKTLRNRSDTPLDRAIAADSSLILVEQFAPHSAK